MDYRLVTRLALRVDALPSDLGLLVSIDAASPAIGRRFLLMLHDALSHRAARFVQLIPSNRGDSGSVARLLPADSGIALLNDLHYIDDESLDMLLQRVHQSREKPLVVVATGRDSRFDDLVTERLRVSPLTLPEISSYVWRKVGTRLSSAQIEKIRDTTTGDLDAIDQLLDAHPRDDWNTPAATSPDSLAKARDFTARGEISTARVYASDTALPGEDDERAALATYLSVYSGDRPETAQLERLDATRRAFVALADWRPADIAALSEAAQQGELCDQALDESRAMALLGKSVTTGLRPVDIPKMRTPTGHNRLEMMLGWISLAHDDVLGAREYLRPRAEESAVMRAWKDAWLARTHYVRGDLPGALTSVERGLANVEARGLYLLEPLLLWTGAQTAAMSGNDALARFYFDRMPVADDAFLLQRLPAAMGRMIYTAATADLPSALRAGEELEKTVTVTDTQHPGYWPWEDVYAQTLLRAGLVDKAAALNDRTLDRQMPAGLVSVNAKNAMVHAAILLQRGEKTAGFKAYEEAAESLEGRHMPTYHARVLFDYARALRRHGRRSRAAEVISQAREIYALIGAPAMVRRCDALHRSTRGSALTRGGNQLTSQEEQVALLVAEGLSNKQVAAQLSLSTKTVEHHLTRAYRKLDVRDRRQLADVMARR